MTLLVRPRITLPTLEEFLLSTGKALDSIRNQVVRILRDHHEKWTLFESVQYLVQLVYARIVLEYGLDVGLAEGRLKEAAERLANQSAWLVVIGRTRVELAVEGLIYLVKEDIKKYGLLDNSGVQVRRTGPHTHIKTLKRGCVVTAQHILPVMEFRDCKADRRGFTGPQWIDQDDKWFHDHAVSLAETTLRWNHTLRDDPKPFYPFAAFPVPDQPTTTTKTRPSSRDHRIIVSRDDIPFSTMHKPVQSLENMFLHELVCPKKHTGRLLLLRIIQGPTVGIGVSMVVEDVLGNALGLNIRYPFRRPAYEVDYNMIDIMFPVGAAMYVREPLVLFGSTTAYPEIHVNVMEEIQILAFTSVPHWRPWRKCKRMAKIFEETTRVFLTLGKYEIALHFADLTLQHEWSEKVAVERCLVLRSLGRPAPAFRDMHNLRNSLASKWATDQRMALSSAASLDLGLLDYASSLNLLDDGGMKRSQVLAACRREQTGTFDWDVKRTTYCFGSGTAITDYHGPIRVRRIPGKGRGLLTSRPIKAGEVILVEKALVHIGPDDVGRTDILAVSLDTATQEASLHHRETVHMLLLHKAIYDISQDPSLALSWEGLCPNPTRPSPFVSEDEKLDAIMSGGVREIDKQLMHRRLMMNSWFFDTPDNHYHSSTGTEPYVSIFKMASMINHSCMPTAHITLMDDVILVRALADIPTDEEITIAHCTPPWRSYSDRQLATGTWDFECKCELCLMDRGDDHVARGDAITKMMGSSKALLSPSALRQLEESYAPGRTIKPELAALKMKYDDGRASLQFYCEVLTDAGCVIGSPGYRKRHGLALEHVAFLIPPTMLLMACQSIHIILNKLKHPVEADTWRESGYHIFDLDHGPDMSREQFDAMFCRCCCSCTCGKVHGKGHH